ncbi:MAG: OmpP1/FadL family transporter [Kofleriaceae bacterium]
MIRGAAFATVLLAMRVVGAEPLDELGFGAAATAMANARAATAVGAEAIHVDPAAVALATRPEVLIGYQSTMGRLSINDRDAGAGDSRGTSLGLVIPFELDELRIGAGVGLYLPDSYVARISVAPMTEPQFTRLATVSHRMVIEPVAAIAYRNFAFGAGASLLADARSRKLAFDVGVVGGAAQGTAEVDVSLPPRIAPLLSARWSPARIVDVSATFRGELSLDLALDIDANVNVPQVVTGTAEISLRSVHYFTPMRVAVAAAVEPRDDLLITGELAWERWSTLGSGVPDLRVLLALDTAPPLVSQVAPPAHLRDIFTPRLGVEWRTGAVRLRAGGGYLPSPIPPQTGLTSFADGARVLTTAGAGIRIAPSALWRQPIDIDLALAWQHVVDELVHKDMALYPGGAFSSGGDIVQVGISSTVRL